MKIQPKQRCQRCKRVFRPMRKDGKPRKFCGVNCALKNTHEANMNAKLSPADVRTIRASDEFATVVAARYGICRKTVAKIRQRISRNDVP